MPLSRPVSASEHAQRLSDPTSGHGPQTMVSIARRSAALLAAGACVAALAGCGSGSGPPAPVASAHSSAGAASVGITVHVSRNGAVTVLAPVYLGGHGPYRFVVDTGASRSIVDQQLARKLGFTVHPSHAVLTGVNASNAAGRISVAHWRIGSVQLPAEHVLTLPLAGDKRGPRLAGLIGSDNLRRFGSFTLDYRHSRLILSPRR